MKVMGNKEIKDMTLDEAIVDVDRVEQLVRQLEAQPYFVKIHRLSETSYVGDCNGLRLFLGLSRNDPLPNVKAIGNCWRCQIGQNGSWHYGRSMVEAIESATRAATLA